MDIKIQRIIFNRLLRKDYLTTKAEQWFRKDMEKENNPIAAQLLTMHNVAYMMRLMRTMRKAIMQGQDEYEKYIHDFFKKQFPKGDVPLWVVKALSVVDINITTTLTDEKQDDSNIENENKKQKL